MQYLITIKNSRITITVQNVTGRAALASRSSLSDCWGKVETTERTEEYYAQVVATTQATVKGE